MQKPAMTHNPLKVKAFIKKYAYLFWYIKPEEQKNISHEVLIEFVLNVGDEKAVRGLFDVLGTKYVATIFYKKTRRTKRVNYFPRVINFFDLYFKRHAH